MANRPTYTVVTLDKRARFFRPVEGAQPTGWRRARRWAQALDLLVPDTTLVWTVDTTADTVDLDGRDVPIRWDAEPTYTIDRIATVEV